MSRLDQPMAELIWCTIVTSSGIINKMRTPLVLVPLLVMIALTLGTIWFLKNFEKKSYEVRQGMSPAARNNHLLAAERYLQALGQPAENRQNMAFFTHLPPPTDAILLSHLPGGMSRAIQDDLYQWIKAGGHLLVTPNSLSENYPDRENILDRLGVRLQKSNDSSDCGCPPESDKEALSHDSDKEELTTEEDTSTPDEDKYHPYDRIADLSIDDYPIQLQLYGATLLSDTNNLANYRINSIYHKKYTEESSQEREDNLQEIEEEGAWLLQYKVDEGTVTALSETTLFNNINIKQYDHAFFLSWLVKDAKKVWLLNASYMDPLLAIIWKRMPYFWISLLILTALIIWKLQKRSGPLHRPTLNDQQNIMTHIEATGHYSWRRNRSSSLVATNRKTVIKWWARKKLGREPDQDMKDLDATALATRFGIAEHDLHDAFRLPVDSEQNMIKTSRALQKIQKIIQGGDTNPNDSK